VAQGWVIRTNTRIAAKGSFWTVAMPRAALDRDVGAQGLDCDRKRLGRTAMDMREQLARDLLGTSYGELTSQKKSVIDLIADQKPSGLGPLAKVDERDGWEKLADRVASVGGSWGFIMSFMIVLAIWVTLNSLLASRAFDPYPFIFLNLMLSMVAALQAPVIMMSQNRQGKIDRAAAEHDYIVNLRAELEIMLLHDKLDGLRERDILARTDAISAQLKQLCEDVAVLKGRG
jgi:uncharacterized membrane protein